MNKLITNQLEIWTTAPKGIKKLRELILELAVRGLLVPQEPNDEPASELLKKIVIKQEKLIKENGLKTKANAHINTKEEFLGRPLNWEYCRLGNLAKFIDYRGQTPEKVESGIPLITAKNVRYGFISRTPHEYIRESDYDLWMTRGFPKINDILFTTEAPLGNVAIVSIKGKFALAQRVICFQLHEPDIAQFLRILIMSAHFQKQLHEKATGMTATGIKASKLKELPIPLPPLPEQHRIVAKVDELMNLCDQLEHKLSDSQQSHRQLVSCLLGTLTETTDPQAFQTAWSLIAANFDSLFTTENSIEQLKQTILQLAVMGKLVPQKPNDEPASELLKKIATEKARLITEGKIKKQNPLPKISEQEKPFVLPDSWEWARIGTVFNGGSGTTPLRSQIHYFINGTENWFKTTDLNLSIVMNGEEKITKKAITECNLTCYPKNTICIAMYGGRGTIGKSGILGVPSTINQSVFALPPIDNFNPHFLHLYVKSIRYLWMNFAAGLRKDPNINGLIIKKMLLPIPPLPEQHRIVAKVDELMSLCEQLKTKLATTQTLQQQLAETLVQQAVA